ncbi:MAG: Ppx/GppA phosphatase family protein [Candidatus Kapabacteria bacterium]|nr:Ppx/GppA phosphatase family protein [Candidatus Kapabacteria bacterium]
MRVSGIDIGTNTILMVIADKNGSEYTVIDDYNSIARLGEGVNKTSLINHDAILRAKNILLEYKSEIDSYKVDQVRAVATSAMRDALNRNEVAAELSDYLGTRIEIISGEEEARLSFAGAVETEDESALIDIGGGSTEIICGKKNRIEYVKSMNIGVVRLSERYLNNSHPYLKTDFSEIITEIQNHFNLYGRNILPPNVFACAGTPTTIAAVILGLQTFDYKKIHGFELNYDTVNLILQKFISVPLDYLVDVWKIHPKRADVIACGTLILLEFMKKFHIDSVTVSAKGLRYGVMKSIL